MTVDNARVESELDTIVDPCSAANGTNLSIVEMGLVADIDVDSSHVTVSLRLTSPFCMQIPYFVETIETRVGDLTGVSSVDLETDQGMEWHRGLMSESARDQLAERKAARLETLENSPSESLSADP